MLHRKQIRSGILTSVITAVLFFLNCVQQLKGQSYYTVNSNFIKSKSEGNNLLNENKQSYPDTSVTSLHEFFPRNFMGNIGIASPEYLLNYKVNDLGFQLYPSSMSADLITDKQVEYFRTKGPYASVNGIAGSKQLQILKFLFTHTYKEKVNIALRFNRYTSKGFYSRQQSYTNNFYLSSNYTSNKKRFGYYFYYLNNGNKYQENGGIEGDSLSASALTQPKELLSVRLSSALRNNRQNQVMFNPWFKLSGAEDSLDKLNCYIQIKSSFDASSFIFRDDNISNSKFYFLFYNDTTRTYDSTSVQKFKNEISFSALKGKKGFGVSIGYRNELNRLWQKTDSVFMNDLVFADAVYGLSRIKDSSINSKRFFQGQLNAQYVVNGPNVSNYLLENKVVLNFNDKQKRSVYLKTSIESRNPDHLYNYWVSNHYTWFGNGFKPVQTTQFVIGTEINTRAGFNFFFKNTFNLLYMDELAYPSQYAGNIQTSGANAFVSFLLFKHLGLRAEYTYQNTSHASYISIPENISKLQVYYYGSLFKGNLQLSTGLQGEIFSSFYGYAYMPATQQFYLQNKEKTAEYPYVTAYLNARIRPVTIFVKVENALQNYAGSNYSFVPGYFQPDRCFRFGINWMFFD